MKNINANHVTHLRNEYITKIFNIIKEQNLGGTLLSLKEADEFRCFQLVPTYGEDSDIIRYEQFEANEIEIAENVYILGNNSEGSSDCILLMDLDINEIAIVLDILENKKYF